MGTLDTVIQMQQSGMSNEEIITNLQTQGISPKEVNDAINQAQIKNAITQAEPNQAQTLQVPSPDGTMQQPMEQQQTNHNKNFKHQYKNSNSKQLILIKIITKKHHKLTVEMKITNNQLMIQKPLRILRNK